MPELVIAHEFGHQYWYGMVATNEFEDPWLDEGINSYVEAKVMNSLRGEHLGGEFCRGHTRRSGLATDEITWLYRTPILWFVPAGGF